MKEFSVITAITVYETHRIEAESFDEARQTVLSGRGDAESLPAGDGDDLEIIDIREIA